jgi:hypothetical protein
LYSSILIAAVAAGGAGAAEHQFSTLFTAQDVRDRLSNAEGVATAVDWCKKTGIGKVYIESFRDGYRAERPALLHAKQTFTDAGFAVSGCVTTTGIGKRSNGWKATSCYTNAGTQKELQSVFEYAASLFDEIMIDDFWFTDCTCAECEAARGARSWKDYRCDLMVRLSRERVLGAAKRVNPKVRLIIKYPQWYDRFHERGYEVVRETADFDRIWVGTETRDRSLGGEQPYEAYFIMRWLGRLGGDKTGGGWYDPLKTTERTYIEQARQTVLGGARESMLFCYGALQRNDGPADILALRANQAELREVAREVQRREVAGIAAYKPPNSHPENESYIFDSVGMLGLPLVPCHEFPTDAQAAFFSIHALKDPDFATKLSRFAAAGKPVLITEGLASKLHVEADNVRVLHGDSKSLLRLSPEELNSLRKPLLRPWKIEFHAPNQVALYLFADRSWVIENFNDTEAHVELDAEKLTVPARGWLYRWR